MSLICLLWVIVMFGHSLGCGLDEFKCRHSGECISNRDVCNGWFDCNDETDETKEQCTSHDCSVPKGEISLLLLLMVNVRQFQCDYGGCISDIFTCDGIRHCHDGSDETSILCTSKRCSQRTFRCNYGGCIDNSRVCNGIQDCHDGSDETVEVCRFRRCSTTEFFRCDYGACIWLRMQCDGIVNCHDGSDESPQLCFANSNYKQNLQLNTVVISSPPARLFTEATPTQSTTPTAAAAQFTSPSIPLFIAPNITTTSQTTFPISHITYTNPSKYTHFTLPPITSSFYTPSTLSSGITHQQKSTFSQNSTKIPDSISYSSFPLTSRLTTRSPSPKYTNISPVTRQMESTTSLPLETTFNNSYKPVTTHPGPSQQLVLHFQESPNDADAVENCPSGQCRCPPPQETICIQCPTVVETLQQRCESLNSEKGCSKKLSRGAKMTILHCGITIDISLYVRSGTQNMNLCGTMGEVPSQSIVVISCWETTSYIMTCGQDGLWRSSKNEVMEELCQPYEVNSKVCGMLPKVYQMDAIDKRTVQPTPIQVWPWVATIYRFESLWCSGTIISKTWVLTAGHCVSNLIDPHSRIYPDEFYIKNRSTDGGMTITNVSAAYLHSNFTLGYPYKGNIGLLRVKDPFTYSHYLSPACLHPRDESSVFQLIAFFTLRDGKYHLTTQTLDAACNSLTTSCSNAGHVNQMHLEQEHFCGVKGAKLQISAELSLGGSALVNKGSNAHPRWAVSGVATHLPQNCNKTVFLFTSIESFVPWITDCIANDACQN